MDTPDRTELLTSRETAALLRVPVRTLYVWRGAGTGPRAYRVGRQVLYDRRDVLRWLEQRREPPSRINDKRPAGTGR
jgi:excisionase family DNA binding protein